LNTAAVLDVCFKLTLIGEAEWSANKIIIKRIARMLTKLIKVHTLITERAVIDKILAHLHAAAGNPASARAPPLSCLPPRQALLL